MLQRTKHLLLDLRCVRLGIHVLVLLRVDKVRVCVLHNKVVALAGKLGALLRAKGVVEVQGHVFGTAADGTDSIHRAVVPAPELVVVLGLIQHFDAYYVGDVHRPAREPDQEVACAVHILFRKELDLAVGEPTMGLAVLRAIGTVQVNDHANVVLVRPVNCTLNVLPAVLVYVRVLLEGGVLGKVGTRKVPVAHRKTECIDTHFDHVFKVLLCDPCVPVFLQARPRALDAFFRVAVAGDHVVFARLAVGSAVE